MGGVRQRRGPKVGNLAETNQNSTTTTTTTTPKNTAKGTGKHPQSRITTTHQNAIPPWMMLVGILAYIPIIVVFNPITIPPLYYHISRRPCVGICNVTTENEQPPQEQKECGPIHTDRVVFVRIPKTASSTVISLFQQFAMDKSVTYVDLQEMEDLISSIPDAVSKQPRLGYHDPHPAAFVKRKRFYYKRASNKILLPPFEAQERTFYEGHLYFFNFTKHALHLADPEPLVVKWMPDWLLQWYHLKRPTQEQLQHIQQITMVRTPQDRLASMYYYDRHEARNKAWREQFIGTNRGNATLEECLVDPQCVEANELRRWCSVQTEMICGVRNECSKPLSDEGLRIAKENIRDRLMFTGVAERMEESMDLLGTLLPTYLEGVHKLETLPFEKKSKTSRRERTFSTRAQAILDDICSMDNELYNYADSLLTERLKRCSLTK